jgi:threonine dehydratase
VRDGRVISLRIQIVDQPGVLARLARAIGDAGGNIIEIYHQRLFTDLPAKRADIDAVVETRNADHVKEITASLVAAGFQVRQLGSRSA